MIYVSAFGVVHKSESSPGTFEPVSGLDRTKRKALRANIVQNRGRRRLGITGGAPPVANHDVGQVYRAHAYAARHDKPLTGEHPGVKATAKIKTEFDQRWHTQSPVHPNIHYGPSTTPKMRARLDRKIDPKIAGGLKHPVVIHHDPKLNPNLHAGAVPAHVTTGGKGHVVLGSVFKPSGKTRGQEVLGTKIPGPSAKGVVNHEIAHAQLRRPPRQIDMKVDPHTRAATNFGEEARADAVSGAKLYRKNGMITGRKTLKVVQREFGRDAIDPGALKVNNRYLKVHRLVRAARKVK